MTLGEHSAANKSNTHTHTTERCLENSRNRSPSNLVNSGISCTRRNIVRLRLMCSASADIICSANPAASGALTMADSINDIISAVSGTRGEVRFDNTAGDPGHTLDQHMRGPIPFDVRNTAYSPINLFCVESETEMTSIRWGTFHFFRRWLIEHRRWRSSLFRNRSRWFRCVGAL